MFHTKKDRSGQGMVELALIAALVSVVSIGVLTSLGTETRTTFTNAQEAIAAANAGGSGVGGAGGSGGGEGPAEPAATTFTVVFDLNGGSLADPEDTTYDTATVDIGDTLVAPDGSGLTPPSGKQFAHWATGSADGTPVTAPVTGAAGATVTLVAVWEDAAPAWPESVAEHDSLAEYSIAELSAASRYLESLSSSDLATDPVYTKFNAFMVADEILPIALENLSGKKDGNWQAIAEGNATMRCRIVGINCKDKAGGAGEVGLTFMAKYALPVTVAYNTDTMSASYQWRNSKLYNAMNSGSIWSLLPTELQSAIVPVSNQYIASGSGEYVYTSSDKLWLASHWEVFDGQYGSSDGSLFPLYQLSDARNTYRIYGTTYTGAPVGRADVSTYADLMSFSISQTSLSRTTTNYGGEVFNLTSPISTNNATVTSINPCFSL